MFRVFAFLIILLILNVTYLGVTGKHLISGTDIDAFAKNLKLCRDKNWQGDFVSCKNSALILW